MVAEFATVAFYTMYKTRFVLLCANATFSISLLTSHSSLQDAILRYNTAHAKKWDFTALNLLCTEVRCSVSDCYLMFMGLSCTKGKA